MKYTSLRSVISKHIKKITDIIKQLKGMDVTIQKSFAVANLVASIYATSLRPATTTIKTLPEDELKWHTVAKRLTEEAKELREKKSRKASLAASSKEEC